VLASVAYNQNYSYPGLYAPSKCADWIAQTAALESSLPP
jgi:hypothetical protein